MNDFGLDVSNPVHRKQFRNFVEDIGSKPYKVVKGTFAGQGVNGGRGDVLFYVKGNDVVVTSPNGKFVTVLENGVKSNTSVKSALE